MRLTECNQSQPQILKMEVPGTPAGKERKNCKQLKKTQKEDRYKETHIEWCYINILDNIYKTHNTMNCFTTDSMLGLLLSVTFNLLSHGTQRIAVSSNIEVYVGLLPGIRVNVPHISIIPLISTDIPTSQYNRLPSI